MAREPFNLHEVGGGESIRRRYGEAGGNKSNCLSRKPQHAHSRKVRKLMGVDSALASLYLKAKVFHCRYGFGEEVLDLLAFSLF